jgi:enterochelin esterase family protein
MLRVCIVVFVLALASSTAMPVATQEPPVIQSPEIRPDKSVVFRLWAPKATEVQLSGDWMGPQPPLPFSKNDQGVWTATAGPLEPGLYQYAFLVDAVRSADPVCRCSFVSGGGRFSSSRLTISGDKPSVWENQNRAPGTLHYESFFSKVQQRTRRFVVYTPPGYASSSRLYPVTVLLPGTPGDETDWTSGGGFAEILFDNLIAEGRMEPMIVVMHASDVDALGRRGDEYLQRFENILVEELVPAVKQRYRVNVNPASWAIVGLSLGGEFGMAAGLKHPELFRTIAAISGSLVPVSFESRFGPALARRDIAREYRLIWIGCGKDDIFYGGAQAFAQRLEAAKVPHVFRQFAGVHAMPVFRQELVELLPRLFR